MQYNKERILSRLMEMIQIDSVSYKEGPMTDYLQKYFEDRGYEVYRDQAGKAVGGDHSGNPVSYTHLDVYKRQPLHKAHQNSPPAFRSAPPWSLPSAGPQPTLPFPDPVSDPGGLRPYR